MRRFHTGPSTLRAGGFGEGRIDPGRHAGGRIDYFLDANISFGVEFKYLYAVAAVVGTGILATFSR